MSWVVLDASFLLHLLLSESGEALPVRLYRTWRAERTPLAAPSLALYEATNALHRYALAEVLTLEEAETLLGQGLRLGIRFFQEPWLHTRALELARALGLKAAYDAHYLALAEGFRGAFWTADRRLYQKALEGQAQGLLSGVALNLLGP
ncbi:type II toxin-antitoxin system VapC family toxin [Thermus oshimai]|uniref:Putative nucleic acid-binding protein, contains PIN domain n=1 Tax=Thermus oshimai JL-2 TaxID=751945 RepID=K7QYQ0_THEOS|nr:type II toxin-antitoxin system VapC family toxin [Thermus oshimai]AFV77183.1 putative nucleic acid-binding protein, contains PIN domain [Thermus oshimai JL-2]